MFHLTNKFIQEYGINKKTIEKASEIIKKGQILSIKVYENPRFPGRNEYIATVTFKPVFWLSGDQSVVTIFFKTKVYDYHCDDISNSALDAFLVASLNIIDKLEIDQLPFYYQTSEMERLVEKQKAMHAYRTKKLLDSFKNKFEDEIKSSSVSSTYQIIAHIENDYGDLRLKFKICEIGKKPYAIKNIGTFLSNIAESKITEYGKALIVNHNENFFEENSQKIINFMRKSRSTIQNYYYERIATNNIDLTPTLLDSWFDLALTLSPQNLNFYIKESNEMPKIIITESDDSYTISTETYESSDYFFRGTKHLYDLNQQILIRTKLDSSGKAIDLFDELFDGAINIPKESFDEFYLYALSDLTDFFDIIGYESKVKTEQSINIYVDVDDFDQVFAKIEYIYENQTNIVGFDEKNKNLSIKAKKIENYISSFGETHIKNNIAYIENNVSAIQNFVNHGLIYLQQYATVYMSESIKRIGTKSKMSMSVGVTVKNNLLQINLDSIDIPKEEIADILSSYKQKKKFHKLKNGEQLYLNDEALEEAGQMLERYRVDPKNITDGSFDVDLFRIFDIDQHAMSNDSLVFDRSQIFREIIDRFKSLENKSYTLAPHYENLLRDYQKHGYSWLRTLSDYGFGGILADDMGLGKTLQVISLLDLKDDSDDSIDKNDKKISIVIAPASLILNWEDEISKFAKNLNPLVVHGSAKKRADLLQTKDQYDLLITSYDYIKLDIQLYQDINFEYIILDEAQYIKNQK